MALAKNVVWHILESTFLVISAIVIIRQFLYIKRELEEIQQKKVERDSMTIGKPVNDPNCFRCDDGWHGPHFRDERT